MAGTFGEYLEAKVLQHVFGSTGAWTASTGLFFGLCTTDISSSGGEYTGKEPSTVTGYTRVYLANTSSNFSLPTTTGTGSTAATAQYNAVVITFPTVTASSWAHVTHAFVSDTSSQVGNMLCFGELTAHKDLDAGDTASFAANSFKITLD
jgi:hypothetical protein